MAHTAAWNESSPAGSDLASTIDNSMRDLKRDMRERLALEHNWNSATADGDSQDGKHKEISVTPAGAGAKPILKTNTNLSLTGSQTTAAIDIGVTWNTSGTPDGIKLNVTDTASQAGATLLHLQVASSTRFKIYKSGKVVIDPTGVVGTPSLCLDDTEGVGLLSSSQGVVVFGASRQLFSLIPDSNGTQSIQIPEYAGGTGAKWGGLLKIGRNTSGNGAPGQIEMDSKSGTFFVIFPDTSGNLRIHSSWPTETSGDTVGTVVGTQTSSLDAKIVLGRAPDLRDLLDAVLEVPLFRFRYKNGSFNGEEFTGLITDHSPKFGMDCDEDHPGGKSLNVVTTIGHLIAAVQVLHARLAALEV